MSISDQPLRWGLLSTARINDRIVEAVACSERSRITAVASRDEDRARSYASSRGIPISYGSYDELVSSAEVDVVYVSLPNWLHVPWGVELARAGKHALIEKPIAIYPGEIEQLERSAEENRLFSVGWYPKERSAFLAGCRALSAPPCCTAMT